MSQYTNHKQFVQVDLRHLVKISMLSIQGNLRQNAFVRSYKVTYSMDGVHQVTVLDQTNTRIQVSKLATLETSKGLGPSL
jgi:hypothetical protein